MKNEIVDWHNYTIHTEKEKVNRYRRVTYNNIDFDILIFTITEKEKTRFFAIHGNELRKIKCKGSIHFTYNSPTDIRWTPDNIALHVKEFHPRRVIIPSKTKSSPKKKHTDKHI